MLTKSGRFPLIGFIAAMALVILPSPVSAQAPAFKNIAPPAQPQGAIALPVQQKAPEGASESWLEAGAGNQKSQMVTNVVEPTLTPFLPAPGKATGAAVIVAPGGAYVMLSMESEGWSVARWLADHGVAAFVLKYRLRPTPTDPQAFTANLMQILAPLSSQNGEPAAPGADRPPEPTAYAPSLEDADAALQLVRKRAKEWGVDPDRVGMMGFSAGAMTTLGAGLNADPARRPNFIAPIYPPLTRVDVPADAPPLFVGIAADDQLFSGKRGFGLIESWAKANRPVEFHLYEKGGHGFGAFGTPGTTTTHWMDQFYWWLESRGLLKSSKH